MIWETFKDQFHESWHDKIRPFIESKECDEIYSFLKKEGRRGKQIAPLSSETFRCFRETSYDELKLIMLGASPYHTFRNGKPVADGLLMSCSVTGKLQPSLDQFYEAMQREVYKGEEIYREPDLSYLAHQGILLLNASLTTEMNKPSSHIRIWEPFMKYLFLNVLDTTGAPILYLGKDAAKYKKWAAPFTWTFEVSHPASAAYSGTIWDSEGVFIKINTLLKNNNGYTINWSKT